MPVQLCSQCGGSWFRCTILKSRRLSLNRVAADVRRLRSISDFGFRISDFEKRASSRRLLRFRGATRGVFLPIRYELRQPVESERSAARKSILTEPFV